jgi:chromosome partitioning protein
MLRIVFVNSKPGTAKSTSAVFLAYAFHERGRKTVLIDADPAASALEWSDQCEGFPFRVAGLPVKDFHKRADDFAQNADVVIGDIPQIEDHAGIARSAMRWADELIVPVAPSGIELDRMGPVLDEIENVEPLRSRGSRSCVLLNRVVNGAASARSTRRVLVAQGHDVLSTVIPRLEMYSQAFGTHPPAKGSAYDQLATELLERA